MYRRILRKAAVALTLLFLLVLWVIVRTRHAHHAATAKADTLVVAQSSDMESMEPDNLNSASSVNIANLLWGRLLTITAEGQVVPSMASSYTWNDAGNEITFHLRNDLHCGDGSRFTAQDVVYTLNRAADHSNGFYGNLPAFVYSAIGFEKAWANNDSDATVRVRAYSSQVPGMLSQAYMLCRKDYEHLAPAAAASHAYATGPYRMVEWARDDRIVLERNPQYTLVKAPFARVVFRIIPEASTRVAELLAGNLDVISNVPPDQVAAINTSGSAKVQAVNGTRRIFVGFNLSPKFSQTEGGAAIQKKAVRQALEYAVDVPTLCAQLLQHPCERMASPVQKEHTSVAAYPYDPDKAEHLLDAAGYPRKTDGVRFHLTLQGPRSRYLEDVNVAQAVAQYLGDVGVATTVEAMDFNSVFAPRARQHEVGELFLSGNGGALWSPLFDLSLFPTKLANTNTGEWDSKAWREDLHALEGVRDPAQETAIINHMQQVFRDEAPGSFCISNRTSMRMARALSFMRDAMSCST
ncbi:ABC transporter substrate-binding protein [Granulicella cerasi]|uniref:ABC transporter substrate-binding protein n=1 Tax=Granulicella cerasi TaxID=741063 RepID=A0ABW1ZBM4_9BACT